MIMSLKSDDVIDCVIDKMMGNLLYVHYSNERCGNYSGALFKSLDPFPASIHGFKNKILEDYYNPSLVSRQSHYFVNSQQQQPLPQECRKTTTTEMRTTTTTLKTGGTRGTERPSLASTQNGKLGVRLRARQVLCHNCKNVCNEKGENVEALSRRRKTSSIISTSTSSLTTTSLSTATKKKEEEKGVKEDGKELVPKLKRLAPQTIQRYSPEKKQATHHLISNNSLSPSSTNKSIAIGTQSKNEEENHHRQKVNQLVQQPLIKIKLSSGNKRFEEIINDGRNLRKKRSAVGSMEDLWDETIFEESQTTEDEDEDSRMNSSSLMSTAATSLSETSISGGGGGDEKTPVLKISFGSQQEGKGTILKIPSKFSHVSSSSSSSSSSLNKEEPENDENQEKKLLNRGRRSSSFSSTSEGPSNASRAAKKALKRARKEAQKRLQNGESPVHYFGGGRSPAYRSPGRMLSPARSYLGGNFSPARSPFVSMSPRTGTPGPSSSSPAYSVILQATSDHKSQKMIIRKPSSSSKHHKKKKHKKFKKHASDESESPHPT